MSDIFLKNISEAFAASLSFDGKTKENIEDTACSLDTSTIEKYAGISIYQPTIDNVELFIKKYTMNELAFFPKTLDVSIFLQPSGFNTSKPQYVEEATGTTTVTINDAQIELPFIIVGGELLPYNIIQYKKQRVPYSRENIKKILFGIDRSQKNQAPVAEFDPYVKVEKLINPTSSVGFLGDVLRIQEQHINKSTGGGNIYVTSEQNIDSALEKLANMNTITDEDWKELERVVKDAVVKKEIEELKKEAVEVESSNDKEASILFGRVKDLPFVDAKTLPHGTVIAFPEVHDKEISVNKGIIIDDYMDFMGEIPKNLKVIITKDSRMKILSDVERFLCLKIDGEGFKVPTQQIDTLKNGDIVMAFDGNKALFPCYVDYISNRKATSEGDGFGPICASEDAVYPDGKPNIKILRLKPITQNNSILELYTDDGMNKANTDIFEVNLTVNLTFLEKAKFSKVPYNEFIKKKSKELGIDESKLMSIISDDSVTIKKNVYAKRDNMYNAAQAKSKDSNIVLCTDENTKVIVIKGLVTGYLKNVNDLGVMVDSVLDDGLEIGKIANETSDSNEEDQIFKHAAQNEFIELRSSDKERGLYNLKVSHIDKTKKVMRNVVREFKGIPYTQVREILKAVGFDIARISEIMARSKNETYVRYELPANSTPEKLVGGQIAKPMNQALTKIKSTLFDSNVSDSLAADIIGALLAGAMMGGGLGLAEHLKKVSNESKLLSASFEKVAQDKRSQSMLKVAKIMATSALLSEKVATVVEGKAQYFKLNDCIKEIVASKPLLEKVATDLIELKIDQYKNKNFIVDPSHLTAAVNNMDNMYKIASCLNNYKK